MLVLFELMRKIKAIVTQLCSYSHVQRKIDFGRIDHETCQNEWSVLTFDDQGLSTFPKASDMTMTEKKNCF